MKGIDISSHNPNIDFGKVKDAGFTIVYIKATEGRTYVNPLMRSQYNGARAAGLNVGFYHFLRTNDPEVEARFFLSTIRNLDVQCRDVIDVEHYSLKNSSTPWRVTKFAQYLQKQNRKVMVYTGDYFYKDYLRYRIGDLPVWIANYSASAPQFATGYYGFQYTETGRISGVSGYLDLNSFDEKVIVSNGGYVDSDDSQYIVNGVVTASVLNVRKSNGTDSEVIGTLNKGDMVRIDKRYSKPGWYSIYFGTNGGFISTEYVNVYGYVENADRDSDSNSGSTAQDGNIVTGVVTASALNVRDGNGTEYNVLGVLKKGDTVKIDKRYSRPGWYSIYFGDHGGFVSENYISLNTPVVEQSDIFSGTVDATVLNVRSGPGTQYSIIGSLSNGTKVKIDRRYSKPGWYSIYFGQHGGFVSSSYIK